jgi:hypothetical protein
MGKIRKIHIVLICGVVACLIVACGMYFLPIKNATKDRDAAKSAYDSTISQGGTQSNVDAQKKKYEEAQIFVESKKQALNVYMHAKMPVLRFGPDVEDRKFGMLALWHEQSEVLGPLLIKWITSTGVKLESNIAIPAPPVNPNDSAAFPADDYTPIKLDLGKVKIQGDFKQIMNHIRKWNDCSRLVLIDQPTLAGTSPNLTCEYNLTVFLFPTAPATANNIVPNAGTPGAGTGMGMGMPGGMPPGGGLPR